MLARVERLQDARASAQKQLDAALDVWAARPAEATRTAAGSLGPTGPRFFVHRLPAAAPPELLRRRGAALRTAVPDHVHVILRGADVACAVATGTLGSQSASATLARVLAALGAGSGRGGGQRDWAQGRLPAATAGLPDAEVDRHVAQVLASSP